jgi:hypothetical protein
MKIYLLIPKVANYFGGPVDTGSRDTETSPYFPPHVIYSGGAGGYAVTHAKQLSGCLWDPFLAS